MAKVYVEVFGCSANVADLEIASGLLEEAGHTHVDAPGKADAVIILTCIVKRPTELRMIRRLRELAALGMPLVVGGCMPKAERWLVEEVAPMASLLGPDNILRIVEVVNAALKGRRLEALQGRPPDRTCLPRVRINPVIHIAPISSGCLGDCSYCIVKLARGRLRSFPADEIVEDVGRAIDEGCREIWVTAEDTAAYRWRGIRLPQLLEELSGLDGRFYIRVGMMTPNQTMPILDELMEAYRSEKVFKFLHVPVQSGSDDVLKGMRRRYTVDDFRGLVTGAREAFSDLSLSTDIICGFPGETEEQFMDSIKLVEEMRPDALNISRFWPRPGTEAADMEGQLHGRETKRRSRMLTRLWRRLSLESGRRWVGW
ncbi:MAG: tRNA (N(6)-L-threonylcarbamoyladenosine(37)-C(2))-methylthiotransferase, partial [Candidatus Bathyarchaeota archaeon]|nr:tRNA (N(6)-L-threonylcarbamoyladenosine(37)-C(2))-methylthiotransferase [Candidatus Bathyarchaeota archaeon]